MIPHVIVLEPGLVIYKINNGYWFWADPLWKISAKICELSPRNAGRIGTLQRPNSKRPGSKAARNSSIRTAKRMSKLSVSRIRGGVTRVAPSQ